MGTDLKAVFLAEIERHKELIDTPQKIIDEPQNLVKESERLHSYG